MVVLCFVVAFPVGGGGGTVSRSGGVGCRPWFVLWRCGAAPRGLLIVLLVRGLCGVGVAWGLGSPGAGCAGLECRNQGGVVVWCLGVSAHRWVGPVVRGAPCMGHARAIAFAGSAGWWVAVSWACCGPGEVPAGGEWRCVAGVYRFHGLGGGYLLGCGVGPW